MARWWRTGRRCGTALGSLRSRTWTGRSGRRTRITCGGRGRAGSGRRRTAPRLGRVRGPLGQPLGEDEGVVAEHEAVRAEVGVVDAVGHGGVDTGERIVEA